MRLEGLLDALRELFGPRLNFDSVEEGWLPVLWNQVEEARVWTGHDDPADTALFALSTAQDIWLRGLGEEGTHPGAWATASPEVRRKGAELVLALLGPQGVLASVRVPVEA